MGAGPIVAGLGLIWMGQLDAHVNYLTELLPAVLVFALGLSMTVAPLTNTVLGSVPQHHAGVASGTNNAISRVAGLLAIAAVGAIVSAQFGSALDRELAGRSLTPAAQAAVREVKDRPLTGGVPAHPELDRRGRGGVRARLPRRARRRRRPRDPRRLDRAGRDRQPSARRARRSGRRPTAPRRSCIRVRSADGKPRPPRRASLSLVRIPVLTPRAYQRVAEVALAALTLIVFTGAAVRLTGSGLGCPDWPKCYGGVAPPLETHAWIEYGNRMISGVVGLAAVAAGALAFRRRPFRRDLAVLGVLLPLGVVGQAVLGGFTVRNHLAPGFVMGHFALSMLILVAAVALAWRARYEPGERPRSLDRLGVWAVRGAAGRSAR